MSLDLPFDAILFDLDGTLIDTESVAIQTGIAVFASLGVTVDHTFFAQLVGVDLPTGANIIKKALPALDHSELQRLLGEAFKSAIEIDLPLKPGVMELLDARHLPMAVVTSSGRAEAHHKMKLTGLLPYFADVITLADVTHPKPAAEPYLLAAQRLGMDPKRCLVFEDSDTGAQAAWHAGCTVVQVPDVGPASGKWAHFLAHSLTEGARMVGLSRS